MIWCCIEKEGYIAPGSHHFIGLGGEPLGCILVRWLHTSHSRGWDLSIYPVWVCGGRRRLWGCHESRASSTTSTCFCCADVLIAKDSRKASRHYVSETQLQVDCRSTRETLSNNSPMDCATKRWHFTIAAATGRDVF